MTSAKSPAGSWWGGGLAAKWLAGGALAAVLTLGAAAARAADAPAAGPSADTPAASAAEQPSGQAPTPAMDSEALSRLRAMTDTLAKSQAFSVTVVAGYDVVQDTGQRIEFGEKRLITVQRPNLLKVDAQTSDGKRKVVLYDGKTITVFDPDENVYGQIEESGGLEAALRYMIQDLGMRMPLALLMVSSLPTELEQRLQSVDLVEHDALTPVPSDHLAGRAAQVDFEVWVASGPAALPQRLTITYRNEEGTPQYRAQFLDWKLDPPVTAADVAFEPPSGAQRIPFLVRVRRSAAEQPGVPAAPSAAPVPAASSSTEGGAK